MQFVQGLEAEIMRAGEVLDKYQKLKRENFVLVVVLQNITILEKSKIQLEKGLNIVLQ